MSEQALIPCKFKIIIDTREQMPFGFLAIIADESDYTASVRKRMKTPGLDCDRVFYSVPTEFRCLGNHRADYSVDGLEGHVHVERKSLGDAASTLFGFATRTEAFDRFSNELAYLASIPSGWVVVEGSREQMLRCVRETPSRSWNQNAKIVNRTLLSIQEQYKVPWIFCDKRRTAEIQTFNILRMAWRHNERSRRAAERLAKANGG